MPTLVQFGAGSIGRGFIAERFQAGGWNVVFVDVDPALVAALEEVRSYRVDLVDGPIIRTREVSGVRAILGTDRAAVVEAVREADLLATAVGVAILPRIAPVIADGLRDRTLALDCLVCENGATAAEDLHAAVAAALPATEREALSARFGCVRTSIGRMIPAAARGSLDLRAESYAKLPVDRAAFRGAIPAIPGLIPSDDFALVLAQKLYLHNLTHACLAYAGVQRGCTTIPDCLAHDDLAAAGRAAGLEVAEALGRRHGSAARAGSLAILDDLFRRYANSALDDPVLRVGRDPVRKLGRHDRLIGALSLCRDTGVPAPAIAWHIVRALAWPIAADDPGLAAWSAQADPIARLLAITGLDPQDPLMTDITIAQRRATAAAAMRAAGLTLREDEAAQLEIADFGLGRFEDFGLAIHVYVNTDRCCAKELMMLPRQICPEHRHPPIDGDPGKEETFRVRQGEVFLFLPGHKQGSGEREAALKHVPVDKHAAFTMYRCVHLKPGDQYTLKPNTPHWFVAGAEGAIVSEFSTRSRDEADVFTDPAIRRVG